MSCAYEEDLTAYLDRELPALRMKQVEGHLPGCASCRDTLALLERTVAMVRTLPAFEPSVAVRRAVLHKIDEPLGWADRLRAAFRPAVLMPSVGVAAAALVAVVLNGPGSSGTPKRPQEGLDVELAANLEVVADYDVVGLTSSEDLEVIEHLQELEAHP